MICDHKKLIFLDGFKLYFTFNKPVESNAISQGDVTRTTIIVLTYFAVKIKITKLSFQILYLLNKSHERYVEIEYYH